MRSFLVILSLALSLSGAAHSEEEASPIGDPIWGAEVFRKCIACHQVGPNAENRSGPQLNGIFGRRAGSVEAFRYSNSMKRASADGLVWDYATLDAYIENPRALISVTSRSTSPVLPVFFQPVTPKIFTAQTPQSCFLPVPYLLAC